MRVARESVFTSHVRLVRKRRGGRTGERAVDEGGVAGWEVVCGGSAFSKKRREILSGSGERNGCEAKVCKAEFQKMRSKHRPRRFFSYICSVSAPMLFLDKAHRRPSNTNAQIMALIEQLVARARADKQRIVLPEGTEERTIQAADRILADGVADLILIGNPAEIAKLAQDKGLQHLEKATVIDPLDHPKKEAYAQLLAELRAKKGMTLEQARVLVENPLYLGCLMIKAGDADGQLAGALHTTGDVLRPALQIIKTAPGITCVSGAMLLLTQATEYGENGLVVMGDVAVTPEPDAEQLAQIAVCSAETAQAVAGIEPRVAMLSFSTKGSAKHEDVDKVVEALDIARRLRPELKIDGELQADAALVPSVGEFKAPGSAVAGHANVLVAPRLEVGNIAYKLVERLGHAEAIGPILQGIARPVNDLSRGCCVQDIYTMVAITANQAIAAKAR